MTHCKNHKRFAKTCNDCQGWKSIEKANKEIKNWEKLSKHAQEIFDSMGCSEAREEWVSV